jgi:hypothetical protein
MAEVAKGVITVTGESESKRRRFFAKAERR